MARIAANGLEIEYEIFGEEADPPLLLVMGLGAQLLSWEAEFCRLLAAAGFRVIRFDNRDIGLSTPFDDQGVPDLLRVMAGEQAPPYTLDDMADDAAALLESLGIAAAHVVGASMGGFIAQLLAIRHPGRVLSLTSIMSGPGGLADNTRPTPEAEAALLAPPPSEREAAIEHSFMIARTTHSPIHFDEARVRSARTAMIDRSYRPAGSARHFAAVAAAPSRVAALGQLRIPSVVIHGELDPLVPVENGRRTAAAIPGARLLLLPTMAHDLPLPCWPQVVEAISEVARAGAAPRA